MFNPFRKLKNSINEKIEDLEEARLKDVSKYFPVLAFLILFVVILVILLVKVLK